MGLSVIVTIGPSIFDEEKLQVINAFGPNIYRINGSHMDAASDVSRIAAEMRGFLPKARLMVDLPGNKIRTAGLSAPIPFKKGQRFKLHSDNINYGEFHALLKPGTEIYANDSVYKFEVLSVDRAAIQLLAHCEGMLGNNKGLHVRGIHQEIPFLFPKDKDILQEAVEAEIDYVALSFVRHREDIREANGLLKTMGNKKTKVIAKVETLSAVNHLDGILQEVDCILVDRGDLACDVGLMNVPKYQELIITAAKQQKKKIILATQFLKNMQYSPVSSIAEEIDLYNTIKLGIDGIQLSEETAVGKYPVKCVEHVYYVYNKIARETIEKEPRENEVSAWKEQSGVTVEI